MNEDIINNRNRLKPVNKYFGKAISDDDKNFYYVNDYGFTHKYESDAWTKNDSSCPNNLTKITKNELDLLQDSVGMNVGQPCKIAGKNIQNKSKNTIHSFTGMFKNYDDEKIRSYNKHHKHKCRICISK